MTGAGAELVRARPWRRVAATAVDWAFLASAAAPALLLLGVSTSTAMTVAGGLLLVLPLIGHVTVFAALGNTLGGWVFAVRAKRNSTESVGRLGHLLRWWVIGWQETVVSLVSYAVTLPLAYVLTETAGGIIVPFSWRWEGANVYVWGIPFFGAFHAYNLWLMGRGRGQTTWDRMMGTFVIEEQRKHDARIAPIPFEQPSAH